MKNVNANVKNWLIQVDVEDGLFGILVIVNVNVTQDNIQTITIVTVENN